MILVVGVAGSGKSTQSKLLASQLGYEWVSVGQLLRSSLSGQLAEKMNTGNLIDDDTVQAILKAKLQQLNIGYKIVLDGFPRRTHQAIWLMGALNKTGDKIEAVIHLNANEPTVLDRLINRGRQDDKEDAINERFAEYESEIKPLLNIFKENGVTIIEINGEGTPEEVHQSVVIGLKNKNLINDEN